MNHSLSVYEAHLYKTCIVNESRPDMLSCERDCIEKLAKKIEITNQYIRDNIGEIQRLYRSKNSS